jgi:hypothetical protein
MKRPGKDFYTAVIVTTIMLVGILGITNPGYKETYQLFDHVEGKVAHNYFIFSIYQQYNSFSVNAKGERIHKRYIGIAMNFYEISPLIVQEE